jgi:hypothetical protein
MYPSAGPWQICRDSQPHAGSGFHQYALRGSGSGSGSVQGLGSGVGIQVWIRVRGYRFYLHLQSLEVVVQRPTSLTLERMTVG